MIGIINYGSGNVFAIANVYKRLNIEYAIVAEPEELNDMSKLILPGVGAFDETMSLLNNSGLKDALDETVMQRKTPILGVCVGMQIMANGSDEGELSGFGWINGFVRKFDIKSLRRKPFVPHLGWNSIQSKDELLFRGIDEDQGFYFLHTYFFECENKKDVIATTNYGGEFTSAVKSENVFGVQFHPEKSHSNGIRIFENFAKL